MAETGEPQIVECPECAASLKVKPAKLGKLISCARCGHRFTAHPPLLLDESSGDYTAPPVSKPSQPDRILINCPECQSELSVRVVYIGQHVRCRGCSHKFVVPQPPVTGSRSSFDSSWSQTREPDALDILARLSSRTELPDDLKTTHDELQTKHDRVVGEHESLQAAYGLLQVEHGRLSANHAELQTTHEALMGDHQRLLDERTELGERYEALEIQHASTQASLAELERAQRELEASHARVDAELERLCSELERLEAAYSECGLERDAAISERDQLAGELAQARAQIDGLVLARAQEEASAGELRNALEASLAAAEEEGQSTQARIQAQEARMLQLTTELEQCRASAAQSDHPVDPALEYEYETCIAELRKQLDVAARRIASLERSNHEMVGVLGSMGVGPIRPLNRMQPAREQGRSETQGSVTGS